MSRPDPMLEALIEATVESGASDLHLTVDRPPTGDEVERMVMSLLDDRKREELRRDRQVDWDETGMRMEIVR